MIDCIVCRISCLQLEANILGPNTLPGIRFVRSAGASLIGGTDSGGLGINGTPLWPGLGTLSIDDCFIE
jgi:hypothetical protein